MFTALFLCGRISFCWHLNKRWNQASKDPLLWVESKAFFERVWVTQRLPYIPPGVMLDKTPNTSRRKFRIGRLTSDILNPSSLMLTGLQKSMTSINSFKKDVSFWSRPRWNNVGGDQRCPRGNRPAYTNVAKFQASTRDPRDKPPRSLHPHSLRSESGKTSEKSFQKEKKKQRRLDYEQAWKGSTPA